MLKAEQFILSLLCGRDSEIEELFKKLSKEEKQNIFKESVAYKQTVLHWAVIENDIEVVLKLLQLGAHVDVRNRKGETPLHWVKSIDVAQTLIEFGANINSKDDRNRNVLEKLMLSEFELTKYFMKQERIDTSDLRKMYHCRDDCEDLYKLVLKKHQEEDFY